MLEASQQANCVVCGGPVPKNQENCPGCGASDDWRDLLAAMEFAQMRFREWSNNSTIGNACDAIARDLERQKTTAIGRAKNGEAIPAGPTLPPRLRCWSCKGDVAVGQQRCAACGVPVSDPSVDDLRYWTYTCYLIKAHCDANRLPLVQAHAAMNDAKSRIAALRNRLERQRLVVAEAVRSDSGRPTSESADPLSRTFKPAAAAPLPRRPIWEILLDPRTIQWLLGFGGVLLVLGLVIWLAARGIFDNPLVVAVALGIVNVAVLAGGGAIIRFTRYQTAGRAITLLASLVMPLNLWFYHANNLVTIGGNLWVAALVCCVLYLAAALVLRDQLFVYVLCGGVAMTGLLMLADAGRFWEIASPATLLVVLGLIAIHAERAFPNADGPFSRGCFGRALFQSGHTLLAAGLLLVLGTQIISDWLWSPLFKHLYTQWHVAQPALVLEPWGRFCALALILAGTYAYFYSDILVRRVGLYVYLGVFTLLWAEMFVIELTVVHTMVAEVAILALAATALVVNLLQPRLAPRWRDNIPALGDDRPAAAALALVRAGQPLGLFLSTVPVLLGLLLHLRATYRPLNEMWQLPGGGQYLIGWLFVVAMLATAVSCRVGAHQYRRSLPWLSAVYFFGTAAATLMAVTGLLSVVGIHTWDKLAPLVMIVPILYIIAARLYRGHTQENPLAWVAHTATGVLIVSVLAAAANLTPEHVFKPVSGHSTNLLMAAFFAEAALFYGLAAAFRKQGINIYLATAAASAALWQVLSYWGVGAEYYTVIYAGLGLLLLVGYRLAMLEWTGLVNPAFQCANALMSLSLVAAVLITLSRLAAGHMGQAEVRYSLVVLLIGLLVVSLLAAWLVQHASWRRWYVVMAITEAALAFLTLHFLSHLNIWEKLEIFSIVVGVAMLVVAHIGWHREREGQDDLVTFGLFFGSLAMSLPLLIAVLIHRCRLTPEFSTPNELGMLAAGVLLLGTGFAFQLRSTTITGATLLVVYLVSLLSFINALENVQTAAIWMMIAGAGIFGAAIVLSIYRDRLLTLPEKVRRREGIFRVLSWR